MLSSTLLVIACTILFMDSVVNALPHDTKRSHSSPKKQPSSAQMQARVSRSMQSNTKSRKSSTATPIRESNDYFPVAIMHGIFSDSAEMESVQSWIETAYPGIYASTPEVGCGEVTSVLEPMEDQLEEFIRVIQSDANFADGFDLVCHSQGTLLCRGYIQECNNPPVRRFISLSGPHAGFYCSGGDDACPIFGDIPVLTTVIDETLMYKPYIQDFIAPSNYWLDPYELDVYITNSSFLPDLNNERNYDPKRAQRMASLDLLVLVGSDVDGIITPWQSAWFSYFEEGSDFNLVPLQEREVWTDDTLGLRQLSYGDRLVFMNSGLPHCDMVHEEGHDWFVENIIPYLGRPTSCHCSA